MTPEKQQIAIAEACGWRQGSVTKKWTHNSSESHKHFNSAWCLELPDYLNDLNAMHEAEKVLTEGQRKAYSKHTYDVACKVQRETKKWRWVSLTASQRAEAFLRTIGKWEDDK